MNFRRVLIANRGEIALRIARALGELEIESVAVHTADDSSSLHVGASDRSILIPGVGARGYLDGSALLVAAVSSGCDAVHPGYGFLSEDSTFATACARSDLTFIGPDVTALEVFGDKARAKELALSVDVPALSGTQSSADLAEITDFYKQLPSGASIIVKAVAGGGGRGMRVVSTIEDIPSALAACAREAEAAFGSGAVYVEQFIRHARHVEIQVAGDGERTIVLGDRDCSLQRRHQKVLEIAPAPGLLDDLRGRLHADAVRICAAIGYRTLATVEFLVDVDTGNHYFIETNPRIQVEHTITEEVIGIDLVQLQIHLAAGKTLLDLELHRAQRTIGCAIQARINLEAFSIADGCFVPTGGLITHYEAPTGPGIRVDGAGYGGYETSPNYDPLLAKVIARGPTHGVALRRCERALSEFRITGVETNISFLRALCLDPVVAEGRMTTCFIDENTPRLDAAGRLLATRAPASAPVAVDAVADDRALPEGFVVVFPPLQATVASIEVREGEKVRMRQTLAVLEAMKMEHVIEAPAAGRVVKIGGAPGEIVNSRQSLFVIETDAATEEVEMSIDLPAPGRIRPDLEEVLDRWRTLRDESRPNEVRKRHEKGMRTARENINDLVDADSFMEFGAFAVADQPSRFSPDELARLSPADGLVAGVATVNARHFPDTHCSVAVFASDYTVFAGTQGANYHWKMDRMLGIAEDQKLPLVWYCEGGGGRPNEKDAHVGGSSTFADLARLSGVVPKISIVAGYCFAGNASVAGMADILIATRNANLGMAGPAMIEGGGLGVYAPTQIGPASEQARNGVVDILAENEADATHIAKQALGYFQGRFTEYDVADQRLLRQAIPENRLRTYDPRSIIHTLADSESFLELRREFAAGMVTGLARVEGRSIGVVANDNRHLGGAIDCDGADKAAHFLQLCDAFDIPVLTLIDTPGFMVGLESEARAAVRKTSRLFIAAAKLGVPLFSVVLRKRYGLGGLSMQGGARTNPMFYVSWPTGEFGGMGLEGAVRLAFRRELEAEADPEARKALFDERVSRLYTAGKAISQAANLRIDAVIDPADTRLWLVNGLKACRARRSGMLRRFVDAW